MSNRLAVICGPTAMGKTSLAVNLAKAFNGEIVSADSRQIFKGMDIITGKDLPVKAKFKPETKLEKQLKQKLSIPIKVGTYNFDSIPVWGLDLLDPDQEFSAAAYALLAKIVIKNIWQRQKLAIVVGGTGFWIKALVGKIDTFGIKPDKGLRQKLEGFSVKQLTDLLKKLDLAKWQQMNQSDQLNPRRLVRAIEVGQAKKKKINNKVSRDCLDFKIDKLLIIGLKASKKLANNLIDLRVDQRIKNGAVKEVKKLLDHGYNWQLPAMSAIGFKQWQPFFNGKVGIDQVIKRWKEHEHNYFTRQLTWFNKTRQINWFLLDDQDWNKKVVKFFQSWYYKK